MAEKRRPGSEVGLGGEERWMAAGRPCPIRGGRAPSLRKDPREGNLAQAMLGTWTAMPWKRFEIVRMAYTE